MKIKKLSLPSLIFIALLAGALFGLLLTFIEPGFIRDKIFTQGLLKIGATWFVNAFKLLAVPIVFISLTNGIITMDSPERLGRLGVKTMLFYITTTVFAIVTGLVFALLIKPGTGLDPAKFETGTTAIATSSPTTIADTIANIVPDNILRPFTNNTILQVITVAIISGIIISKLRDKLPVLRSFISECDAFNMKLIGIVMSFAPIGVFCLLAQTFVTFGIDAAMPLIKYILCVIIALGVQLFIVYGGCLKLMGKFNIITFYKKFWPVMLIAFSSSSSNATLPVNLETLENKMGVKEGLASFTLALGATVNMDGTAIVQSCGALFIAQLYGIELSVAQMVTIVITALIASIGTAGVPGVGMVMLAMVLQSVNLPIEGIAVILSVDRILDMIRTAVNVTGDAVCTCIVAKSEKQIDIETFNRIERV